MQMIERGGGLLPQLLKLRSQFRGHQFGGDLLAQALLAMEEARQPRS